MIHEPETGARNEVDFLHRFLERVSWVLGFWRNRQKQEQNNNISLRSVPDLKITRSRLIFTSSHFTNIILLCTHYILQAISRNCRNSNLNTPATWKSFTNVAYTEVLSQMNLTKNTWSVTFVHKCNNICKWINDTWRLQTFKFDKTTTLPCKNIATSLLSKLTYRPNEKYQINIPILDSAAVAIVTTKSHNQ